MDDMGGFVTPTPRSKDRNNKNHVLRVDDSHLWLARWQREWLEENISR